MNIFRLKKIYNVYSHAILFQDLVQLVNSDQPFWLTGLTEMSKTFGLQLLESMLVKFPSVFFKVWKISYYKLKDNHWRDVNFQIFSASGVQLSIERTCLRPCY